MRRQGGLGTESALLQRAATLYPRLKGNSSPLAPFGIMARAGINASVIDRIRREISRIRAYIHSQPQHEELTDVDTLLSVADSEAERHKRVADRKSADSGENKKKPTP